MIGTMDLKRHITNLFSRNPLSAILQCADDITNTMTQLQNSMAESGNEVSAAIHNARKGNPASSEDVISSAIDSAQTITLCAQHQKRIGVYPFTSHYSEKFSGRV